MNDGCSRISENRVGERKASSPKYSGEPIGGMLVEREYARGDGRGRRVRRVGVFGRESKRKSLTRVYTFLQERLFVGTNVVGLLRVLVK
jgi:hypothetical protein